ncbi:MAG: hypothetical protein ABSC53_03765 [Bacteroidota bacterium]
MSSQYTGNGKMKFPNGNEYPCTFTIHHPDSADTEVYINTVGNYPAISADYWSLSAPTLCTVHLSGQTINGFSVATDVTINNFNGNRTLGFADFIGIANTQSLISSHTSATASYECFLTNLLFCGTHSSPLPNGGRTMDRLPVQLYGRNCELRMLASRQTLRDSLKKTKIEITACITIPASAGDTLQTIEEMFFDILSLISFAQGCFVSCVRIEEKDAAGVVTMIHLLTAKTRPFVGGFDIIPDNTPTDPHLKLFLEQALPNYLTHKSNLQLHFFLTYYLESKLHNTKSIKFLLACIAAECIKSNFAVWQGLPKAPTGWFAHLRVWMWSKVFNQSPRSFRALLTEVFRYFGITGEKFTFIKFRNYVVHTGDESLSFPDWRREHFKLVNQLDRLFLKICGYRGSYVDINDNFSIKTV